jgi:hypothetical protein
MLLIRVSQGKQIFFRQMRPGKNGKSFGIVKFCTMTNGCDAAGRLLPDAKRLTLMTVLKVVRREGISAEGEATMPEFMGEREDVMKDEPRRTRRSQRF